MEMVGNELYEKIEHCNSCGFTAVHSEYIKHDCYWVFREMLCGERPLDGVLKH